MNIQNYRNVTPTRSVRMQVAGTTLREEGRKKVAASS
jgi:hypothetical protein